MFENFSDRLAGTLLGRAKAINGAVCYEAQICTGNANGADSWRTASFTPGSSQLRFTGLTTGQLYSFRLRVLGRDGWSEWSNVEQMIAA